MEWLFVFKIKQEICVVTSNWSIASLWYMKLLSAINHSSSISSINLNNNPAVLLSNSMNHCANLVYVQHVQYVQYVTHHLTLVCGAIWNFAHSISWIVTECVIFREKTSTWLTVTKTKKSQPRCGSDSPAYSTEELLNRCLTGLWMHVCSLALAKVCTFRIIVDTQFGLNYSTQSIYRAKPRSCFYFWFVINQLS